MSEVRVVWRAGFDNAALNRLHAEAFDHGVGVHDWLGQVRAHSLGWVCAFDGDDLVGFVNVAWDGRYHAFIMDTSVAFGSKRQGIGRALIALAVPVGAVTMLDPGQNPQAGGEAFQLRPILFPSESLATITPFGQYNIGHEAATYLDGMHLENGTVLVDGAMGFPIILESNHPTQFITTPDRDFQEALLDPTSFGVKYLLVPEDVGYQSLDALNRAYPGIYQTGAGVGQLVKQFSAGGNNWRLYQVGQ